LFGQLVPGTPILFVSNFNLGAVSMYQMNPFGQLVNYGWPFGRPGDGDGCLRGPQGMAVNDAGEIYVADALNNRMTQWQLLASGQVAFVRAFKWGSGACECFYPTDAAIDARGRVFVTDQFNNRICVFDRDGVPLWTQGKAGYWEEGEPDGDRFMLPASLAIDGDQLIVNDLVNRALKHFRIGDVALEFEGGIGLFKRGIREGGVWMPFFLHAQDGDVYVADSTYNVVQVFRLSPPAA
jgi:DNA-binding beta-propeller fold protein YncE